MPKKLKPKKQAMVNAMREFFSNITRACEKCKVSRFAYYQWYKNDALFREHIDDLRMLLDDNIETTAISKCLNDRDTTMLIFMLKTRMKARGYVEKTEVEQVGELRIMQETSLDFSKLSVDELRALKLLSDKAKK